jgi:hypothetical protein
VRIDEFEGDVAPVFPWLIESLDIPADPGIALRRYKRLQSLSLRETESILENYSPEAISMCIPHAKELPALRSMKLTTLQPPDMKDLFAESEIPSYTKLRSLSLSVASGSCDLQASHLKDLTSLEDLSLSASVTLDLSGMDFRGEDFASLKTLRANTSGPAGGLLAYIMPPPPEAGEVNLWQLPAAHLM